MELIPDGFKELDVLKDWQVVEQIGRGGSSRIFRLERKDGEQQAALKWIHLERRGDMLSERFLAAQAQIINELRTQLSMDAIPQIVSIRGYSVVNSPDGRTIDAFIRMDLLTPLTKWMRQGSHTVKEVMSVLRDISIAVDECHSAGILHRDIKPENILCDETGFKLSDFGVAGIMLDHDAQTRFTRSFAPPEYQPGSEMDKRGDLYSLGLTAYTLFNNDLMPYQQDFTEEDRNKAWAARMEAISSGHTLYPPPRFAGNTRVAEVLCKACAIDPQERYPSAGAFYDALDKAVHSMERFEDAVLPFHDAEVNERRKAAPVPAGERPTRASVLGGPETGTEPTDTNTTGTGLTYSTGRATRNVMGGPLKTPPPKAPEAPEEGEKTDPDRVVRGFDDEVVVEEKPEEFTIDLPPEQEKKPKRWILWVSIAGAALLSLIILICALSCKPNATEEAPPAAPTPIPFTAVSPDGLTIAVTAPDDRTYTCWPAANGEKDAVTVQTVEGTATFTGLIPGTVYTVKDSCGMQQDFQTEDAQYPIVANVDDTRSSARLAEVNYSRTLDPDYDQAAERQAISARRNNSELECTMTLKNAKASKQAKAYYLIINVTWAHNTEARPLEDGQIVLRLSSGKTAAQPYRPNLSTDRDIAADYARLDPLIDTLADLGVEYGDADLEVYSGDVLLVKCNVKILE